MKKIIIIVAAVIGLMGVNLGASVFLVGYLVEKRMYEIANPEPIEEEITEVEEVKGTPVYFPLDPFVVNFLQNGDLRYLQITLELMSRRDEVIEHIRISIPEIRNSLILILSDHDYLELASREGKELIRQQVQQEVNRIINDPEGVESVFLTGFVMQ